jgi:hypothetical protein
MQEAWGQSLAPKKKKKRKEKEEEKLKSSHVCGIVTHTCNSGTQEAEQESCTT